MRTIDFTVETDPDFEKTKRTCYCYGYYRSTSYEIRLIRPDDVSKTVIETVITDNKCTATEYIRHVTSSRQRRLLRSPSIVAASFYSASFKPWSYERERRPFKNPIAVVSLCFGGSHCLIYQIEHWMLYNREELADCPIKKVLEDPRFTIVGLEKKKFTDKVKEQWDCDLANEAVDLRSIVAEGYGREKFDVQRATCEEMADIVLGMKVREKSKNAANFEWSKLSDCEDDEMVMLAARDSFLAFEVATKCFQKLNRKI